MVDEYAQKMRAGVDFTPVTVFHDGHNYWLQDGYHHVAAAERMGRTALVVEVRQGSRRDALLYSVSAEASAKHYFKHTLGDRWRATSVLIRDTE